MTAKPCGLEDLSEEGGGDEAIEKECGAIRKIMRVFSKSYSPKCGEE